MKGIYKLVFEGLEDWPYVGQSLDIERRYKAHLTTLKAGHANKMLQEAYEISGEPKLEVLEETEDLDNREMYWINKLDSINNGLNLTSGGDSSGSGYLHARSKFSREQIIDAFNLLINPKYTLENIYNETGVSINQLNAISKSRSHLWLADEFPVEYHNLVSVSNRRLERKEFKTLTNGFIEVSIREAHEYFTDELGYDSIFRVGISSVLKSETKVYRGWKLLSTTIEYPPITNGSIVVVLKDRELSSFAKEHSLHVTSLSRVLKGKQKSTKGWSLVDSPKSNNYPYPPITDGKRVYFVKYRGISSFCAEHPRLCHSTLTKLLNTEDIQYSVGQYRLATPIDLESLENIYQ